MSPLPPEPDPVSAGSTATVLGLRVDALGPDAALKRCAELIHGNGTAVLITGNALMAVEAQSDPDLRDAWLSADLVLADSTGLVWASRWLNQPRLHRLPGIDLAYDLCRRAALDGTPVYLFGGAPGVADQAAHHLRQTLPGLMIAGSRNGFFDESDNASITEGIRRSGARLILVALGMPRQEKWIHAHKIDLPAGLCVGVGGSFDVWAGTVRRAPRWVQRLGFEWFFRLILEPWRAKRMLGLPAFAWRVIRRRNS